MSQSIPQPSGSAQFQNPVQPQASDLSGSSVAGDHRPREYRSRFADKNVGFGKLLRSEWIKLSSLGSTYWLLGVAFVLTVGIAALFSTAVNETVNFSLSGSEGIPPEEAAAMTKSNLDSAKEMAKGLPTLGVSFSILVFGAWAVVTIAGEYGTGMIRSTMTAAPKRWSALLAKLLVAVVVASVVAFAAFMLSYGLGQLFTDERVHYGLDEGNVMRSILMNTLYVALIMVMGFGIGLLTRNAAGGIVTIVAILFILPIITGIFGGMVDWVADAGRFTPDALGQTMGSLQSSGTGMDSQAQAEAAGIHVPKAIEWNVAAMWLAVESLVIWVLGMFVAQKRDV